MDDMIFSINDRELSTDGDLIYRTGEYSFDFLSSDPTVLDNKKGGLGTMSLCINTLQIDVGVETGNLLYPWGYLYIDEIESVSKKLPAFVQGNLLVKLTNKKLDIGDAMDIPGSMDWVRQRLVGTHWIYIGKKQQTEEDVAYVEFAKNSVAGIQNGALICLYLKPRMVKE